MFTSMTPLHAAGLWSGLLIILMVMLSMRVVMGRFKHRVVFGDGDKQPMTILTRGFGNAAEYIPIGVVALVLMALLGVSTIEVHVAGGLLWLGRVLHPLGLAIRKTPNGVRVVSMVLTWFALLFSSVVILQAVLTHSL